MSNPSLQAYHELVSIVSPLPSGEVLICGQVKVDPRRDVSPDQLWEIKAAVKKVGKLHYKYHRNQKGGWASSLRKKLEDKGLQSAEIEAKLRAKSVMEGT